MSRAPYKRRHIRKLTRTGGYSLGVTIPVDIIDKLGWRERQKLVVTRRGKKVIVQGWKK